MTSRRLTGGDYRRLLAFRDGLRRFLHWSEHQAAAVGLTPAQHQLLLAVRGHGHDRGPAVGDVAAHLLLRHHSAVELVDRAVAAGLVARHVDPDDRRVVRLALTDEGAGRLEALAALHLEELARLGPRLAPLWAGLGEPAGPPP
jgi:DNA-binding MarR family transcriptional regulator